MWCLDIYGKIERGTLNVVWLVAASYKGMQDAGKIKLVNAELKK